MWNYKGECMSVWVAKGCWSDGTFDIIGIFKHKREAQDDCMANSDFFDYMDLSEYEVKQYDS